jgi:hypothetical protein
MHTTTVSSCIFRSPNAHVLYERRSLVTESELRQLDRLLAILDQLELLTDALERAVKDLIDGEE